VQGVQSAKGARAYSRFDALWRTSALHARIGLAEGGGAAIPQRQVVFQPRRPQSNGSQSAKQKLRQVSGKERRVGKQINHETSKAIVGESLETMFRVSSLWSPRAQQLERKSEPWPDWHDCRHAKSSCQYT